MNTWYWLSQAMVIVGLGGCIYFSLRQYRLVLRLNNELYQSRLIVTAIPDVMLEDIRLTMHDYISTASDPTQKARLIEILAAVNAEEEARRERDLTAST